MNTYSKYSYFVFNVFNYEPYDGRKDGLYIISSMHSWNVYTLEIFWLRENHHLLEIHSVHTKTGVILEWDVHAVNG